MEVSIDVALVPLVARPADRGVVVVVDQIRASTTLTTLLDLGCPDVIVTDRVRLAYRLARQHGRLLAGEWHGRQPAGFDFDNSPTALAAAATDVRDRGIVLCTTNGTVVLERVRGVAPVLVGCLRNARAAGAAAAGLAGAGSITVVCAGREGRFVLEDALVAGTIARRAADALETGGHPVRLTDAAVAAVRLREATPDLRRGLEESDGGAILRRIGIPEDIAFCATEDATDTVPIAQYGELTRVVPLVGPRGGECHRHGLPEATTGPADGP